MSAYIEFVIIDNFVITILIGAAAYRFLRVKICKMRLVLCGIIGTVMAVIYPFITLNNYILLAIKIVLGLVLSVVLFAKKYNFLKGFSVFMIITFMFGGLLIACGMMLYGNINDALTKPLGKIPLGVILGGAIILYVLIKKIFLRYHRLGDENSLIMDIKIEMCGKTITAKGFLDTGNKLYDVKTGLPVVIISAKTLLPYLEDSQIALLLGGRARELFYNKDAHYLSYSALGNLNGKILVTIPDKFTFYYNNKVNIINDVMVGLSFSKINYQAILHPSILSCIS